MSKQRPKLNLLEGSPWKTSLALALPMMLSQLLQYLYSLVDTFFIALIDRSSTALLSGTGLVFPLFFAAMSIGIGLNTGTAALIARGLGERNPDVLDHAGDSGLLLAGTISLVFLFTGYLYGDDFVRLLAGPQLSPAALSFGMTYFYLLIPGLCLLILGQMFYGILQAEGLMTIVAKAMVLSTSSNLILDPILIFGLKMGVAGAATATSISILISFLYVLRVFHKNHRSSIKLNWNPWKAKIVLVTEILRIGIPQLLGMLSLSIAFMFLNHLVSSISETHMAAWTIVGRSDFLILMPAFAISNATMTMIGQNFGHGLIDRVRRIFWVNLFLTLWAIFIIAVAYNLFAPYLFRIFTQLPDVLELTILQVRMLSFTYLGVGGTVLTATAFQATGRPIPALILTVIRAGVLAVPLAYFLVLFAGIGILGIYLGLGIGNVLTLGIGLIWIHFYLKQLTFKKVA